MDNEVFISTSSSISTTTATNDIRYPIMSGAMPQIFKRHLNRNTIYDSIGERPDKSKSQDFLLALENDIIAAQLKNTLLEQQNFKRKHLSSSTNTQSSSSQQMLSTPPLQHYTRHNSKIDGNSVSSSYDSQSNRLSSLESRKSKRVTQILRKLSSDLNSVTSKSQILYRPAPSTTSHTAQGSNTANHFLKFESLSQTTPVASFQAPPQHLRYKKIYDYEARQNRTNNSHSKLFEDIYLKDKEDVEASSTGRNKYGIIKYNPNMMIKYKTAEAAQKSAEEKTAVESQSNRSSRKFEYEDNMINSLFKSIIESVPDVDSVVVEDNGHHHHHQNSRHVSDAEYLSAVDDADDSSVADKNEKVVIKAIENKIEPEVQHDNLIIPVVKVDKVVEDGGNQSDTTIGKVNGDDNSDVSDDDELQDNVDASLVEFKKDLAHRSSNVSSDDENYDVKGNERKNSILLDKILLNNVNFGSRDDRFYSPSQSSTTKTSSETGSVKMRTKGKSSTSRSNMKTQSIQLVIPDITLKLTETNQILGNTEQLYYSHGRLPVCDGTAQILNDTKQSSNSSKKSATSRKNVRINAVYKDEQHDKRNSGLVGDMLQKLKNASSLHHNNKTDSGKFSELTMKKKSKNHLKKNCKIS